MSLRMMLQRQIRQAAGQDPIEPCGAELPHASHTYPLFGPNGSKTYRHCEGVKDE